MKSTLLWTLIVVNAVLLCTFIGRVTHESTAVAQPATPGQRRLGDYLMIAGEVDGGPAGLCYVVDTSNELLGALAYDDARNQIDVMPVINLKPIFNPK